MSCTKFKPVYKVALENPSSTLSPKVSLNGQKNGSSATGKQNKKKEYHLERLFKLTLQNVQKAPTYHLNWLL